MSRDASLPVATRELRLDDLLLGRSKGYGLFQDRFGVARRCFDVDIDGRLVDGQLRVYERFDYGNGETSERTWWFQQDSTGAWTGRASDSVGLARGHVKGNVLAWRYTIRLPVGQRHVAVRFDDRLIRHSDTTAFGHAQLSKLGITIGYVFLTIVKVRPSVAAAPRLPVDAAA